jgi:hypothetical protein
MLQQKEEEEEKELKTSCCCCMAAATNPRRIKYKKTTTTRERKKGGKKRKKEKNTTITTETTTTATKKNHMHCKMQQQKMEWFAIKREQNCYGLFGRRINGGQQRQQTDSQSTSRRSRIPRVSPQIWALVRTRHKTRPFPSLPFPWGPSPTSERERGRERFRLSLGFVFLPNFEEDFFFLRRWYKIFRHCKVFFSGIAKKFSGTASSFYDLWNGE